MPFDPTMRSIILAFALCVAHALSQSSCSEQGGNWYCSSVNAIIYTGVGGSASYNQVTNMDNTTGTCSSVQYQYSGSLAPFDEELSIHLRGPAQLKSFAAYIPGSTALKNRRSGNHLHQHRHSHGHGKRHARRGVGSWVTATIDGQAVSWINEYTGWPAATTAMAATAATNPPAYSPVESPRSSVSSGPASSDEVASPSGTLAPTSPFASNGSPASIGSPASSDSPAAGASSAPSSSSGSGSWTRIAYYNAEQQQTDGLVFLNHYGGQGSGVFDYAFGNSLSYASSEGTAGSATSQTLADCTLPSSAEIVLMTNQSCGEEDGSCGYYRPGNVAYHGFGGQDKAFFFEFLMPSDGQTTTDPYDPVNMPALWFLNAQIPRTLQYGNSDCSCWVTGCGEFDVFEVLTPGYTMAKSTVHGNKAGGDSNYFVRPESSSMKIAVVMSGNTFYIKTLSEDADFGDDLASNLVTSITQSIAEADNADVSIFNLS